MTRTGQPSWPVLDPMPSLLVHQKMERTPRLSELQTLRLSILASYPILSLSCPILAGRFLPLHPGAPW